MEWREDIVAYYTEGWCWNLAWHLQRYTGGDLWVFGSRGPGDWGHVTVKIGNRYFDLLGPHTRAALKREWGNQCRQIGPFKSRREYVKYLWADCGGKPERDTKPARTVAIARYLAHTVIA